MELRLPPWRPTLAPADGDADLTWAYPWPAGERLARDLPALQAQIPTMRGGRLAEIGCGRGHAGLHALLHGAAHVTFCDLVAEPLAYVAEALRLNQWEARGTVQRHAWGEPIPGGPYQGILGADILYRPAFQPALLTSIASSLTRDGWALLADPRSILEQELPHIAAEFGLSWSTQRRPGPYTLTMLQRRDVPSRP